jgi:4-hydroxy-tetrahydrodipicolinate synthase
VGIPIVIYNIASRTGKNITVPVMKQLAQIPGIIGVKEASGDVNQMGDIIREISLPRKAGEEPFLVLSGDDSLTLPLIALGGDGIISVISNLIPKKITALAKACLAGDFEEGRRLHYELLPFAKTAFIETNPVPIKAAMNWAGLSAGPARLPLGPLSDASEPPLRAVVQQLGFTLK